MSVLGVGLDLVEVGPFARQLGVIGTSFTEATFTNAELVAARSAAAPGTLPHARHLAARFAAKEAFVKAWSMARAGRSPVMDEVIWHDLEIICDEWGRPTLSVRDNTGLRLEETLGPVSIAVSLTHEDNVAGAVAILSAVTVEGGKL